MGGTADTSYEVKGPCPAEFWSSAEGTLQFDIKDGTLPRVSLAQDGEPMKVTRLVGVARLREGQIEMRDARLDSPEGKFQLSGTASLQGELDLELARVPNNAALAGYTITGTLAEPQVNRSSSAETQARLKPDPAK